MAAIITINVSDIVRTVATVKTAVFKKTAQVISDIVWDEFQVLVKETPQWTGTAAASWNLTLGQGGDRAERTQSPRTKKQALQRGHGAAVGVALAANQSNLDYMRANLAKGYTTQDIAVTNYAESSERAMHGPGIRPINQPIGAQERFESNLAFIDFEIEETWNI